MDSCVDVYEKPQHTAEYLTIHINGVINAVESFRNVTEDDPVRYQLLKDNLYESRKKCEEALNKLRAGLPLTNFDFNLEKMLIVV